MAAFVSLLLLLLLLPCSWACIKEYGTIAEGQAIAGGHFDYSYNGLDWSNRFATCRGQKQSPLLLPVGGAAAASLAAPDAKSTFSYGTLSNAKVVNNGHTLQVSLPADFKSAVKIPIKGPAKTATATSILNGQGPVSFVKATPAQLHFHTHSEHVLAGSEFSMEMHIVHFVKSDQLPACGDSGCPVVLGVMLALTDNEADVKPELRRIIEAVPYNEGSVGAISGDLDVNALLPANRQYVTYEGSLTTPPCTEGLLWHVLTTPIKISNSLLTRYLEAVGDLNCPEKADIKAGRNVALEKGSAFVPPTDTKGCAKLANGHNFRAVQPANGRVIKLAA